MASPTRSPALAPTTPPTQTPPRITLRQPTSASTSTTPTIPPPPLSWLAGTWSVTHSSLPLWRKHRNVHITYTPLPHTGSAGDPSSGKTPGSHIRDVVTYQPLDPRKTKVSTVRGVDKPRAVPDAPATKGLVAHADTAPPPMRSPAEGGGGEEELASLSYHWRGSGWLVVASSRWEILGWGEVDDDDDDDGGAAGARVRWVVTFFEKTVFSPAGVDFYARGGRLSAGVLGELREAVQGLGGEVARLGAEVLEVATDAGGEGEGGE